jgi:uncharacterized protein (UPF0335 family)
MSRPGEVAGDQLRTIVERIERIEEEIKELNEGKKDIYLEAKGNGFDVKVLRQVIRIRKQNREEREEQASLLDVYLQAIEGLPKGDSLGEKKAGASGGKAAPRRGGASERAAVSLS